MAPPLILRIIGDSSSVLKSNEAVIASNTLVGKSALGMGADFEKAAAAQVAAGAKAIQTQRAMVEQLTAARAATVAGSDEQIAATVALESAQLKLNRSLGLTTSGLGSTSQGARTAENDLNKLTRGALAGSGVVSSLGRSLAFASTGFIAVAGAATLLHSAITEALSYAAAQKQVEAQLKTSGLSFDTYKGQIESALTSESKLSGFTRQDLLQSFGYLVRVSGDVGQSLKFDAVAADVARGRHIALSSASIALAKALGGSSTALRRLGIIVPKTLEGMQALNYVAAKFSGQAEAGATSADHFHASLANAEEVIGAALLPTFNRLITEFSDWLSKMQESGRLQRDANELFTTMGDVLHPLEEVIRRVDDATGSFLHTVELLVALEFASKIQGWVVALRILAGEWGLVGAAAVEAGTAQAAAVGESGAAAASASGATIASTGGIASILAGGALGRLLGRGTTGVSARVGMYTGEGAVAGEGGLALSATGIGALAVAAVLATAALTDLAKTTGDKLGAGSTYDKSLSAFEGFGTGGLAGNAAFSPFHAIFGAILHGNMPFSQALQSTFGGPQPRPFETNYQFQQAGLPVGLTPTQLFGPPPSSYPFGVKPMTQFWKTWTTSLRDQMAVAQAALTKGTADDVAEAKKEVAQIKNAIDEGRLHGPALFQALQIEANDLNIIWGAEAAAAQKQAAEAAAAKAKIIAQIQAAIDPIKLEVALSKAQSLGQSTVPALRALLQAAYKGLAKALADGNQQLIKAAYDQITSLKQQIKDAQTAVTKAFTEPMKLQIALARAAAFGKDDTQILEEMKRAALKALKSGKYTGQSLIDLLNEIASINSQLDSSVTNAYGDYKKASLKAETAGLGLTRAQRQALEARLSQRGPGGTTPEAGTGAAGYVIDPATGRPVRVRHRRHHSSNRTLSTGGGDGTYNPTFTFNIKLDLDGTQVARTVTVHQQAYRKGNPPSRRGPHAGTPTA